MFLLSVTTTDKQLICTYHINMQPLAVQSGSLTTRLLDRYKSNPDLYTICNKMFFHRSFINIVWVTSSSYSYPQPILRRVGTTYVLLRTMLFKIWLRGVTQPTVSRRVTSTLFGNIHVSEIWCYQTFFQANDQRRYFMGDYRNRLWTLLRTWRPEELSMCFKP